MINARRQWYNACWSDRNFIIAWYEKYFPDRSNAMVSNSRNRNLFRHIEGIMLQFKDHLSVDKIKSLPTSFRSVLCSFSSWNDIEPKSHIRNGSVTSAKGQRCIEGIFTVIKYICKEPMARHFVCCIHVNVRKKRCFGASFSSASFAVLIKARHAKKRESWKIAETYMIFQDQVPFNV